MLLRSLFLAVFVGGLGLAVFSMLHGIERARRRYYRKPSPVFNAPTAAAFAVGFGASAYLFFTRSSLPLGWLLLIAAVIGTASAGAMIGLLAGWALPHAHGAAGEEEIQGQLARVTRAIALTGPGEIVYTLGGVERTAIAESSDGIDIPEDAEVVIESLKDGIARVELWSAVEQRL